MSDNYESDSMDEVPTMTLDRALNQIADGTVPPEFDKCLVLMLNTENGQYNVRTFSCGMTYMDVVTLMDAQKYMTLKALFGVENQDGF